MKTGARMFTVEELNDICAIYKEEIAGLKERVRNLESWHKDPRVFTVAEVRPLMEALTMCQTCASSLGYIGLPVDAIRDGLTHARKLGVEGGE